MLAQSQVLMLPLDVQNTREGTNFEMYMMWYIIVMASLFYLTVVLPFGLFYSETDEEKEFVSDHGFSDDADSQANLFFY